MPAGVYQDPHLPRCHGTSPSISCPRRHTPNVLGGAFHRLISASPDPKIVPANLGRLRAILDRLDALVLEFADIKRRFPYVVARAVSVITPSRSSGTAGTDRSPGTGESTVALYALPPGEHVVLAH